MNHSSVESFLVALFLLSGFAVAILRYLSPTTGYVSPCFPTHKGMNAYVICSITDIPTSVRRKCALEAAIQRTLFSILLTSPDRRDHNSSRFPVDPRSASFHCYSRPNPREIRTGTARTTNERSHPAVATSYELLHSMI